MMNCTQSICCAGLGLSLVGPSVSRGKTSFSQSCNLYDLHANAFKFLKLRQQKVCCRLVYNAHIYGRCTPAYAFSGKGNETSKNEPFSWESLKKAMGGFKKDLTVQDLLREREQMREKGFDGNGGDGNSRGGGGGGGEDSDSPEDEGFAGVLDEIQQVVLAVIGVVFLYVLMIHGEELTRLFRDYIRFVFGGKSSVRLSRAMESWQKFYRSIDRKVVVREDWLERAIVATPTWWHDPQRLARLVEEHYRNQKYQDC